MMNGIGGSGDFTRNAVTKFFDWFHLKRSCF
jgi:acyl-CoA hydrolase